MNEAIDKAWKRLADLPRPRLADLFAEDAARLERLSTRLDLPGGAVLFDWSKTHLDAQNLGGFEELAEAAGFAERRAALFGGEVVNPTEGRAAEHTAQRGLGRAESCETAGTYHARMHALVEAIHGGALGEVRHLIHIGIGGSALGPALAVDALARDGAMVDVHVVSNIDGL
ncbi:MAG TPA: glucose-6-phosphate isomerase, partial [Novosphingobium sp.]|nr:glucose-6-phosphate isomerase [Novosphingobium sp.]